MKKSIYRFIFYFALLQIITACAIFGIESIEIRMPERELVEEEVAKPLSIVVKDSVIMRCRLNYVQINWMERIYYPYMGKYHSMIELNYNGSFKGFDINTGFSGSYNMEDNNISFTINPKRSSARLSENRMKLQIEEQSAVRAALQQVDNYIIVKRRQLELRKGSEVLLLYDIVR